MGDERLGGARGDEVDRSARRKNDHLNSQRHVNMSVTLTRVSLALQETWEPSLGEKYMKKDIKIGMRKVRGQS
jgi:hypothetical protein